MTHELKAVAHPLRHNWVLYYDASHNTNNSNSNSTNTTNTTSSSKEAINDHVSNNNNNSAENESEWDNALRDVCAFDTVEDFWCMFNNVKTPSILSPGSNYRLFRADVEPKWEHPANAKGGRWTITVPSQAGRKQFLDKAWLHAVLACIGERLDADDQICGVVVNVRRVQHQDKISVWTRDANDKKSVLAIGARLKHELELPDNAVLTYSKHLNDKSSGGANSAASSAGEKKDNVLFVL